MKLMKSCFIHIVLNVLKYNGCQEPGTNYACLLDMGIAIKKPGFEQCLTLGVLSWRTQAGLSSWQLSLDCVIWYLNFSSSVNKEDFFDCFFLS